MHIRSKDIRVGDLVTIEFTHGVKVKCKQFIHEPLYDYKDINKDWNQTSSPRSHKILNIHIYEILDIEHYNHHSEILFKYKDMMFKLFISFNSSISIIVDYKHRRLNNLNKLLDI